MLVPAILYKEQITKEFQKYLYTTDMMYVTGCLENWVPNILECPDEGRFQYAIVDENEKLIGYLGYSIDYYASRAYNFGLFSFDRGNLTVNVIQNSFIKSLVSKKHPLSEIKADMRLKGLRGKEYIHSIGKWDKYIKYLKENL